MMYEFVYIAFKFGQFTGRKGAEKNAVLNMVAISFQHFKKRVASFVIGNIIGNQIVTTGHNLYLVVIPV